MEFSAVIFGDGVGLSRHITRNHSHIPATLSVLAISALAILPVDSYPSTRAAVRSDPFRPPAAVPRSLVRRMQRIRHRSATEDGDEDGFFDGGGGDDGPFGGGSGGGKGCGPWRPRGSEWEEPDRRPWFSSSLDPAFDVIYEILCWIALSNCANFAFKKMSRLLSEREKNCVDQIGVAYLIPQFGADSRGKEKIPEFIKMNKEQEFLSAQRFEDFKGRVIKIIQEVLERIPRESPCVEEFERSSRSPDRHEVATERALPLTLIAKKMSRRLIEMNMHHCLCCATLERLILQIICLTFSHCFSLSH